MRLTLRNTWGALVALGARLLRPRELLVRSEGRVRYIVFSTPLQAAGAGAVLLVAGWLAFSSIGLVVSGLRIDERDQQIRQAKIAYLDLLAEVGASYDGSTTPLDHVAAREPVSRDRPGPNGDPLGEIDSIEAWLQRSAIERARAPKEHHALQAALRRYGADLRTLAGRNRVLTGEVNQLAERLHAVTAEKVRIEEHRQQLSDRLRVAEAALAEEAERSQALETHLARLETHLAAVEAGEFDPAEQLDLEVASIKRRISKGDEKSVEERIGGVLAALSGMIGQRDDLKAARAELHNRILELETRLAALRETQDEIVQNLAERTRGGVEEVEKTVAMTGLDVDMLLARARQQDGHGIGGPYLPVDGRGEPALVLASVADLDDAVARWESLQFILRTLPISSPVDSYWISSQFGVRKDPITGRSAKHEGLDLAAQLGAPVLASAPGRVVYAGHKGGYGRMVEIDHGLGIHTRHGHLRSISVKKGDVVGYRDLIGTVGNTGRSTGPHLHYEILVDGKPIDPMNFLKAGRYVFKG